MAVEEKAKPVKVRKVTVASKHFRFVDLINDVEITQTPKEVVWHDWLQSQIDAGHLIVSP